MTLFWLAFGVIIVGALAFDLGVVGRQKSVVGAKEALALTAGYVTLALLFGVGIYYVRGSEDALSYYAGFVLEYSLSVDNIFVFVVVFGHFKVPAELQHRVLFWGVLGAVVMRAVLIFAGAALLNQFHWLIYVFGLIVLVSGVKLLTQKQDAAPDIDNNPAVKFLRKRMRITDDYEGPHFTVRRDGVLWATPLLLTLVVIEFTDLVFALDSIPAIFGVTRDPFLVLTSNAFAVLGLRSLYFALADAVRRFSYLHYGLSIVLIMIGLKMLAESFVEIPVWLTLSATVGILAGAIVASLVLPGGDKKKEAAAEGR